MTELKRCPFCGKEPQLLEGAKMVFCGNPLCGMSGSMDLKFWTDRPIEDELNAELKNVKELLDTRYWLDMILIGRENDPRTQ